MKALLPIICCVAVFIATDASCNDAKKIQIETLTFESGVEFSISTPPSNVCGLHIVISPRSRKWLILKNKEELFWILWNDPDFPACPLTAISSGVYWRPFLAETETYTFTVLVQQFGDKKACFIQKIQQRGETLFDVFQQDAKDKLVKSWRALDRNTQQVFLPYAAKNRLIESLLAAQKDFQQQKILLGIETKVRTMECPAHWDGSYLVLDNDREHIRILWDGNQPKPQLNEGKTYTFLLEIIRAGTEFISVRKILDNNQVIYELSPLTTNSSFGGKL